MLYHLSVVVFEGVVGVAGGGVSLVSETVVFDSVSS
jgi:hypothetical protein